ncbi:hypothetical protein BE17_48255 [Sorangium cellulosum]|uniref:Uncharacterized protein n=1 Tax=Sorangium cellulosum TaxID=56 RepID=A0A150SIS1_SORCE|nr:hypothetical protein BE17_48255 [Sorangium cellulosum]
MRRGKPARGCPASAGDRLPAQKNRILRALNARGHVVGYMGDGINDAPSLHTADVGISVAGAVDVARDAAEIVLLDHRLAVLRSGFFVFLTGATPTYPAIVEAVKRALMRRIFA